MGSHANFLDDIRPQLAKLAECLGATLESDTEKSMGRMQVDVDGYRARLFINQAWNGKATISIDNANVPAQAWNQYHRDNTPTISVNLMRDPFALARDIERRLLAPSAAALRINWGRACAWLDAKDAKASFAAELAAEFPDLIRSTEWSGETYLYGGGAVSLSGTLDGAEMLNVKHGSIRGRETIRAFLRFVREQGQ